jgi:hypothetical protein
MGVIDPGKLIFLFRARKKRWTALGTKMVVGFDGESINWVKLSDIKRIDSKRMKELPDEPTRFTRIPRKLNEKEIIITDKTGNESIFTTRKGKDLFSLWSILLMISRFDYS